ncbi:MAG: hypothetical protein C0424_10400 [Sphingobacteriaceae bacterium]|nr:hypothetical protein [Sphingobacteriaceae bacterium]
MTKNLKLYGVLAALCVLVVLFFMRACQPRQQVQNPAALQKSIIQLELQALNALAEMEAAQEAANKLILEADSLRHANQLLQQRHGRQLAELRKKPPVAVTTTNIKLAECDSAIDVGQSLMAENEKQYAAIGELHNALDACQDAHSKRDSMELLQDQRQLHTEQALAKAEKKLDRQVKRTRFWQGTTFALALNEARRWLFH